MSRRPHAWAITGVLVACAATACSPSPPHVPSSTSSQAAQFRASDAPALLVQCMLDQGTLGRSDSIFSGPPAWLRGGNVVITPATAAKFDTWYHANDAITVAGKDLTEWTAWAAANDKLPPAVCGTAVSASALQWQVFGKDPAAGNPWGAQRSPGQASTGPGKHRARQAQGQASTGRGMHRAKQARN